MPELCVRVLASTRLFMRPVCSLNERQISQYGGGFHATDPRGVSHFRTRKGCLTQSGRCQTVTMCQLYPPGIKRLTRSSSVFTTMQSSRFYLLCLHQAGCVAAVLFLFDDANPCEGVWRGDALFRLRAPHGCSAAGMRSFLRHLERHTYVHYIDVGHVLRIVWWGVAAGPPCPASASYLSISLKENGIGNSFCKMSKLQFRSSERR